MGLLNSLATIKSPILGLSKVTAEIKLRHATVSVL
jgi:hypothetical protein